ncbi:hypothetical protein D3C72_1877610 [compost metagenome]
MASTTIVISDSISVNPSWRARAGVRSRTGRARLGRPFCWEGDMASDAGRLLLGLGAAAAGHADGLAGQFGIAFAELPGGRGGGGGARGPESHQVGRGAQVGVGSSL